MSTQLGLGVCPLGTSTFGFGVPTATPPLGGAPLKGADGTAYGARKLDLKTKQYVYGATGRATGDSTLRQQMQLVASTDVGSCAVLELGNAMRSIQDITPDFVARVRSVYTTAFARLVERGLVQIRDIVVEHGEAATGSATRALVRIKFKDLATNQPDEMTL